MIHKISAGVLETAAKPGSDLAEMKGPLWLILAVAADELLMGVRECFLPPAVLSTAVKGGHSLTAGQSKYGSSAFQ